MKDFVFTASWHDKLDKPSEKYYYFEKEIFGGKFSSCPNDYDEFKVFFKKDYLKITIQKEKKLIGLLLADVLIPNKLCYLRLIGINENYRNQGVGATLFSKFIQLISSYEYFAFVSNNKKLESITQKTKNISAVENIPYYIEHTLTSYNSRLKGVGSMKTIDKYYKLLSNIESDAVFYCYHMEGRT